MKFAPNGATEPLSCSRAEPCRFGVTLQRGGALAVQRAGGVCPADNWAMSSASFSPTSPVSTSLQLRALQPGDVADVLHIQAQCYGSDFVEGAQVFTRRLQAAHHCSWAAAQGEKVVAYLAAYWSRPGKITPLQGDFEAMAGANVLYLHDMAVLPAWAGQGIAAQLLQAAVSQARGRGVQRAALVAVQGAASYWERRGFVASAPADAAQTAHLRSYGPQALYMEQHWGSPDAPR